ncbi:MAG: ribokinase, partial [Spirochaetaceae bacterium]|nr:ribokinase [Spirochaetaceae bacterium]
DKNEKYRQSIFNYGKCVDTTAAGDTFTGYFLAGIMEGMKIPDVLKLSTMASSIAITREGAVPSIPIREEVEKALKQL